MARYSIKVQDEGLEVSDAAGANGGVYVYIGDPGCAYCSAVRAAEHAREEAAEDAGAYTEDERNAGLHEFLAGVDEAEEAAEAIGECEVEWPDEDERPSDDEARERRLYFHDRTWDLAEFICDSLNAAYAAGVRP